MTENLGGLFDDVKPVVYPIKGSFEGHKITPTLKASESEFDLTLEIECFESDQDDSPCTKRECQMKSLYSDVGSDAVRVLNDIEFSSLSARVDWSDPEEPWIEIEP